MNEKLIYMTILGVLVVVSIAGILQFNSVVGRATYDYKDCTCQIQLKNELGQIITPQPIETQLRMHTWGQNCQVVCEHHYRGDNMVVIGIPG